MKGIRRIRQRLCALLLALACLMGLAACGGPDFGSFSKELTFGDKQISDTQTTYVMKIPEGKLGDLIGPSQIQWVIDQYGDPPAHTGAVAVGTKKAAKDLLRKSPELQCRALENTYQEESSDEGKWEYKDSSCRKQRKLSWLEKTLWNMYQVQSDSTIEWLSTSRNTLVAANDTVSTLQANATPNYDSWFAPVNRYLRIAQGVLVAAAAISLIVLSARIVWNIGQGGEGRLLDRIGWILLGVLLGSSCASIALTFFSRSSGGNPGLPSWTPGGGTTFFLSDYIRMQVDPFLIIAAVCGVIAAGWKLVTQQEGRDLIPLGKAFMWAILSAVCLAGLVNTFQATFDTWTADVLRSASGMMNDAWESKSLAASSFFNLGAPVAIVLTIVMWICGLISKIFAYFRAGMLPILVGVAPMWAAMSWMETGKQAFAKTIGWLAAFLAYKPVAALVMATGSAIMATAGPGDDSQAITLMLTLSVIILLPAMIRVIVPAVQSSVGGGGGGILPSILGMGVAVAGGGLRKAMGARAAGKAATAVAAKRHRTVPNPVPAEVWPDCFPDSAGATANHRERTAAASTPSRWKAIPRAANHRTPATSHRERTARATAANRRERTAMVRGARFRRHPMAHHPTRQAATGRRGRTAMPAGSPARAHRTVPTARPLARARHSDAYVLLRRFG